MSEKKVLVVDDEADLVVLLQRWLQEDEYEVYSASSGEEALKLFYQYKPELSITDLRMPGMDGFQLISRIREMSDVHVLVFSAFGDEESVVRGLELGADEYLVKPVSKRVFLARVRSLLRRASPPDQSPEGYGDSTLTMNYLTYEAQVRGQSTYLRPTEFRLLAYLVDNHDRVISQSELLDRVWGDHAGSLESLVWYISSLRQKVEVDQKNPVNIVTVPRMGYRYVPN